MTGELRSDYSASAAIICSTEGLTMARPLTTTVGTVSLPDATLRTNAAASASSQILCVAAIPRNRPFDVELTMGALPLRLAAWVLFGHHLDPERALALATHQQHIVTWPPPKKTTWPLAVHFSTKHCGLRQPSGDSPADRKSEEQCSTVTVSVATKWSRCISAD